MAKSSENKVIEKKTSNQSKVEKITGPNKCIVEKKKTDKFDKKNNLYLTLINVNVTDRKKEKQMPNPKTTSGSPKTKQNSSPTQSKSKNESKKSHPPNKIPNGQMVTKLVNDQYFYHVIRQQIADFCKQNEAKTVKNADKTKEGKKIVDEKPSCSEKKAKKVLGCEKGEAKKKEVLKKLSPSYTTTVIKTVKKSQ